ncbi:RNAPII degradation factor [Malassezia equina]|uniref:RNA polymerase II degradation factor 1 n=1 Tax=Malassezia equina TaxID=1381935 RepID=A0AAF0IXF0_9BASI|nr:RNAPII degradation factor [Malassezia equina]
MTNPSSAAAPRLGSASRRRAAARGRSTASEDDTEQVRALRAKYPTQLAMLSELFPTWSDEDLLFVLQESGGEVEVAVGRISDGHAEQFSSVKSKKTQKKEAAAAHAAAAPAGPAPALPTAPSAAAGPAATATPEGARRARGATRGRGAAAPAARAGRGGFRGVARGGAAAGAPAQADTSVPVTTTAAAFPLKNAAEATPRPAATSSNDKNATAAPAPATAPAARPGMSWAQVARPPPPKPAVEATTVQAEAPQAVAPPTTETFAKAAQEAPASAPVSASAAATTAAPATAPAAAPASAPATAPEAGHTPSRASRASRPRPEAAVILPGGASLDHLGVQFGSLNFMAGDGGEPASAPASSEPVASGLGPVAESSKPETQPVASDFDAFHSHALAGAGAYGLGGARPTAEEAAGPLAYGASPPGTTAPGYSSLYALDSHQRTAYGYMTPSSNASGLRGADERSTGATTGPLTPGVGAAPTQAPPPQQPAAPEPQAGMQQQPFPNVMPYYYPYYMPNQFQHFSPAAGFGQYPLYGGQPQQPPKQPEAAGGLQAYAHDSAAATPYSTHTPPQAYQPTPGGAMPTYESQGFAQRLGAGAGGAAGASDFKLAGSDANGALPSLGFLGAGAPPGVPAVQGRGSASATPNVSSPLDYRSLEASKGAASRPAAASTTGAVPPPSGVPTPQGQQAPMAQQHPAYYQQYAGFNQANAYDGYAYRQPYWG